MRKAVLGLGLAGGMLLLVSSDARACGDKFLVVGRSVRSQRALGAAHPASILLYMNPKGVLPAAMKELQLESNLKLAGHRLHAVEDLHVMEQALRSGQYDVVMADLSDVPDLQRAIEAASSRPMLLPVVVNPTAEELAAAQKQFRCLMKAPSRRQSYLAAIDEAMSLREKPARAVTSR